MTKRIRKLNGNPARSRSQPGKTEKLVKVSRDELVELRRIERRYRALLNDRNEFISSTLPDLTIAAVNDSFCRYCGKRADEMMGKSFLALVPRKDRKEISRKLGRLSRKNPTTTHEQSIILPDKDIFWQLWNSQGIFNKAGDLIEIQLVGRDISLQKRTESALHLSEQAWRKSEALYRNVVDDQTEIISRYLPDGTLTFVNGAYCRYFQKIKEDIIGHSFFPFVDEDIRDEIRERMAGANPREPVTSHEQKTSWFADGPRWQQWVNRAIFDNTGRLLEFQAVARDITELKKAQFALEESRRKLMEQKKVLEEKNIFLHELLEQIEVEKKQIKEDVIENVDSLLLPIVKKIQARSTNKNYTLLLERALGELTASFGRNITRPSLKLSPKEVEICTMIKNGFSSKEIAKLLFVSLNTVEKHRENIRRKMNLRNKKVNLTTFLQSL